MFTQDDLIDTLENIIPFLHIKARPKLIWRERKQAQARSATAEFSQANRRSNRHFLGRAVCSVGETNNTQDSTPGLSEFGKVSQHLHYVLAAPLRIHLFRRTEKYHVRKKMPTCTYKLPKQLPFYDRGRGFTRHILQKNNTADFRPRRAPVLFRETTARQFGL